MKYKLPLLMAGDVLVTALALFSAFALRFGYDSAKAEMADRPAAALLLFVLITIVCTYIFDGYNVARHREKRTVIANTAAAVVLSFVMLSMIYFVVPQVLIGRGLLALSLATFGCYQALWHLFFLAICSHPFLAERILVIGTGALADKIGGLIRASTFHSRHLMVRYVPYPGECGPPVVPYREVIEGGDDLVALARKGRIARIVVAVPEGCSDPQLHHMLLNCKLHGIEVLDAPSFLELLTGKLMLENMDAHWLIYADGFRCTTVIAAAKRAFDVMLALFGLVLALPLLPLAALLVKLDSPGPIFFSQVRVGQWEKSFVLYKLRTMRVGAERETGAAWAQENDPRVGRIGRFLRKVRLDEIPQLYNVLRGDMSFIGPRPERPEFVQWLDQQIPFYAKRHFIKPGLTGWAQVNFPYGASVEDSYEKLRYDLYYFKNMSLVLDTIILLKTFRVVVFGYGGR